MDRPGVTVLHTVNSVRAEYGGPSRSVPALVAALADAGVEARLHVADRDGRPGVAADLVHDHGLWLPANHAAARAAARAGVPFVVSPRGMLEPWALAHRRWKKRAAWALYQRRDLCAAAAVHATSEAEAESVRRAGVRAPVAVVPNGVHLPGTAARARGTLRRALYLSRIHPVKGLPMLVEAWAAVRPAGWELVVAGPDEGGHRAEVEAQVAAAGLTDAVRFAGPVPDVDTTALYRSADLFVLPTHSENFGLVIAEALAAGVPVLTTTGAPWPALVAERAGWWVDPTVPALTDALRAATATPRDALDAMGTRGRAHVEATLGWPGVASRMAEVYRWVLGRGSRPDCAFPA